MHCRGNVGIGRQHSCLEKESPRVGRRRETSPREEEANEGRIGRNLRELSPGVDAVPSRREPKEHLRRLKPGRPGWDVVRSLKPLELAVGLPMESRDRPERGWCRTCLLYTSPSPRDGLLSRMP